MAEFCTTRKEKKVTLDDFEYVHGLGEGSFGRVVLVKGRRQDSERLMALKQQAKRRDLKEVLMLEQRTLQCAREAPFCSRLLASFQTSGFVYLVTDYYCHGSLHDQIEQNTAITGHQLALLAAEVSEALCFLHRNYIVHRDIKPENIMFDAKGHSRLIDFGAAFYNYWEQTCQYHCGTPSFWAPEVFRRPLRYDRMVDWWALGVSLLATVLRYNPFDDDAADTDDDNHIKTLKRNVTNFSLEQVSSAFLQYGTFSLGFTRFIGGLLERNPARRLGSTEEQVRSHPLFLTDGLLDSPEKWQSLRNGQLPPPLAVSSGQTMDKSSPAGQADGQPCGQVQLLPDQEDTDTPVSATNCYSKFDTCFIFEETEEEDGGNKDGAANKGEEK